MMGEVACGEMGRVMMFNELMRIRQTRAGAAEAAAKGLRATKPADAG